jgi:hypothetical protein
LGQLARKIEILEQCSVKPIEVIEAAQRVLDLICPWEYPDMSLRRYGSSHDGGYVLPEKLVENSNGVISLGVGNNIDADIQLAKMGLSIHAWDHTVTALPSNHAKITFHKFGVGAKADELLPLRDIGTMSFPGVASGLILMMDVEGAEWEALRTCDSDTLGKFDVISAELHGLGDVLAGDFSSLSALKRINEEFVSVALHANNHCATWLVGEKIFPDCVEITFVRRALVGTSLRRGNAQSHLFSPCCPDLPDIELLWTNPKDAR